MKLGIRLDGFYDWNPLSVVGIRKDGLIEQWNKANPDRAVLKGDEIIKVNDILWHHNSKIFVERIHGQFLAGSQLKEGAKLTLTLHIQRPVSQPVIVYQSQREDRHRREYS